MGGIFRGIDPQRLRSARHLAVPEKTWASEEHVLRGVGQANRPSAEYRSCGEPKRMNGAFRLQICDAKASCQFCPSPGNKSIWRRRVVRYLIWRQMGYLMAIIYFR